jgi:hypothetical protein
MMKVFWNTAPVRWDLICCNIHLTLLALDSNPTSKRWVDRSNLIQPSGGLTALRANARNCVRHASLVRIHSSAYNKAIHAAHSENGPVAKYTWCASYLRDAHTTPSPPLSQFLRFSLPFSTWSKYKIRAASKKAAPHRVSTVANNHNFEGCHFVLSMR